MTAKYDVRAKVRPGRCKTVWDVHHVEAGPVATCARYGDAMLIAVALNERLERAAGELAAAALREIAAAVKREMTHGKMPADLALLILRTTDAALGQWHPGDEVPLIGG